jgi:hypothetical protein
MEAMTVTQLGSLYEGFRTHGFLNVYAVKHSPRFGPALVNFSVQDLINRVNADLLALTQPPLVIQDANTRWVEAEIPPAYLGMHYLGNADAVKHFDLYNQHIPNRTPAAIKSKLRYFRRKFQVNEWQAAYVNNHVHNPFNLPVVQQNIQNLAAQVAELQNQLNLLQQQAFQQHNPGPQNPPSASESARAAKSTSASKSTSQCVKYLW